MKKNNQKQRQRRSERQNDYEPNAFANYGVRKTSVVQNDNEEYSTDNTDCNCGCNRRRNNRKTK